MPNTEVKPFSADGTWLETAWESMSLPVSKRKKAEPEGFVFFHIRKGRGGGVGGLRPRAGPRARPGKAPALPNAAPLPKKWLAGIVILKLKYNLRPYTMGGNALMLKRILTCKQG